MRCMRLLMTLSIIAAIPVLPAGCGEEPPTPEAQPEADTTAPPPASAQPTAPETPTEETVRPVSPEQTAGAMAEPGSAPPQATTEAEEAQGSAGAEPASIEVLAEADAMYDRLLSQTVSPNGLVDYGLLASPSLAAELRRVVQGYARAPLPDSPRGRIAFWCNAYNANVLAKVLEARQRPDFRNVAMVEGFFDADTIAVAGQSMTLDDLGNEHVRPLGDPRIHAALVFGAMSCPPLRDEPYAADQLDRQLEEQCRRWVNDLERNRVEDGRLALSKVFERYDRDFQAQPFNGVAGFLLEYAQPGGRMAQLLQANSEPSVRFIDDDWSLNQAPIQSEPVK